MNNESEEFDIETGVFRKNEKAWNTLFDIYPVDDEIEANGLFEVTSRIFNEKCKREARLMAKIESHDTMPSALKKRKLCILPNKTRGNYVIGHFDAFKPISYRGIGEEFVSTSESYDTLDPYNISKEPSLILTAFNYGILNTIAHDQDLKMTNFGRESTPEFEFYIDNITDHENPYNIKVGHSQLEMDGVFESEDYIINVEAKMSQRTDFLARQLYYPYRLLYDKTNKDIFNVFMTYSANGSMYTHVYTIKEPTNYNSFELVSATRYNFFNEISISDIANLVRDSNIISDPSDVIFPQADSMNKIFDALNLIKDNPGITDSDLAHNLSIVDRQGGYYGNACEYIGISHRIGSRLKHNYITPIGEELLSSDLTTRNLKMIELISRHEVFNHFILEYLDTEPPQKEEISNWMREHIVKLQNDKVTADRRASTVKSWIDWILDTSS